MNIVQILFISAIGYFAGSIPSGKIIGHYYKKIDIQKHGSGNIGFANAYRVLGPKLGVAVLVSDIVKSFVPLTVAKFGFGASVSVLMIMGSAAILGHAFPVWLKFRGGKSVATGLGVILVLSAGIAIVGLLFYLIAFAITRKSAIGSLAAAWSLPATSVFFRTDLFVYCLALALFAVYTHRNNIQQLILDYAR